MGKRSTFTRRKHDAYDTPPEAVAPLLDHLPSDRVVVGFWEPCAGSYQLAACLEASSPLQSLRACDIAPRDCRVDQGNALKLTAPMGADYIITNPPWTREILHPMIAHFSAMRPTWLLFDADWAHTKQAAPYLPWCRKIVSVGRVKWIPDSPHTGKDNAAWYLFDQHGDGPTEFYGRPT